MIPKRIGNKDTKGKNNENGVRHVKIYVCDASISGPFSLDPNEHLQVLRRFQREEDSVNEHLLTWLLDRKGLK
jgi:hypothetical protein